MISPQLQVILKLYIFVIFRTELDKKLNNKSMQYNDLQDKNYFELTAVFTKTIKKESYACHAMTQIN